jgi:predicted dehydrogenase
VTETNRRDVLKAGAALAATAAVSQFSAVHAAGGDKIKVGVIGCGGRGSGAIRDSLNADPATMLWAAGDVFEDKAKGMVSAVAEAYKDRTNAEGRVFGGLDAYQKVIDSGCDLIILAASPGFRPVHLEAAVKAKKHIFCEKPVAVDGPGIRKCLSLVDEIKKNGTALVAGTQRRHQPGYLKSMAMIHGGAIGDIVSTRCSWNGGEPWFRQRQPGQSDVEYQINNWYHFLWVCGDHIVEQHVHNLDVINWAMKGHPVKCVGQGGRIGRRPGKPDDVGHIYDLFALEYEYAGGIPMYSFCSHVPGTTGDVSEQVYGSKGTANLRDGKWAINGKDVYQKPKGEQSPYVLEHIDMIRGIREGKPANELQSVAESTLTAIMGRMAVYSGEVVTWEAALNSEVDTMPKDLKLDQTLAVSPVPRPVMKRSRLVVRLISARAPCPSARPRPPATSHPRRSPPTWPTRRTQSRRVPSAPPASPRCPRRSSP